MDKCLVAVVPSLLWCPTSNGRASPIATVGEHMARVRLLLGPTAATGRLTSAARCYCRGTCVISSGVTVAATVPSPYIYNI
jgi:hypothetical protein